MRRVGDALEKGVPDTDVLTAARETGRVVVTYDRKDFADASDHAGVLITEETMAARDVRRAVERIDRAYPSLDEVVEFLPDWT